MDSLPKAQFLGIKYLYMNYFTQKRWTKLPHPFMQSLVLRNFSFRLPFCKEKLLTSPKDC